MRLFKINPKKSVYVKLLVRFIAIIMLLVISLSILLFNIYNSSEMENIKNYQINILTQISYSSMYMDTLAKNIAYSVLMSRNFNTYQSMNTSDSLVVTRILNYLNSLVIPNPCIYSIYLYNGHMESYISSKTGGEWDSKEFYDIDIVHKIENADSNSLPVLKPVPRRIALTNGLQGGQKEYKNVYTYILSDSVGAVEKTSNAVIVNIDADWLKELILKLDSTSQDNESNITVINNQGIIINSSEEDIFMQDISNRDEIKKILSSGISSGFFINKTDLNKQVISYSSSEDMSWKFVASVPHQVIFSSISKARDLTIGFSIIVLIIGIVFSIILSNQIYLPIRNLTQKIGSVLQNDDLRVRNVDEYEYLSDAFSQALEKIKYYENVKSDNMYLLKNEFLKKIILNSVDLCDEHTVDEAMRYTIKLDFEERLFLFLLKIDNYNQHIMKYNEENSALFGIAISEIAGELVGKYYTNEVVEMANDHMAVLMAIQDEKISNEDIYFVLAPVIKQIQDTVNNYLSISLSAIEGYIIEDHHFLSNLYHDTLNLSSYIFKYGHMCTLLPSVLDEVDTGRFMLPADKEKRLINALKLADFQQTKKAYDDIIVMLINYSYNDIYATIIYMAYAIYNSLNIAVEKSDLNISKIFDYFWSNIIQYETIFETNQAFEELFKKIIAELDSVNSNKSGDIVENMIRIIQEKYCDKNFYINEMADILGRSPAYLGKLFKEKTSKSVSEYIMDLRMEKVKYLLDTTTMNINNILEKSGIEKSNYFYTNFKKHFGISLSTYRQGISRKEI